MRADQPLEQDLSAAAADPESATAILLVDDQPFFLALTSDLLRCAGFRTTSVTSGDEALVTARMSPPAAILLDVMMPGLDGIETCRRLKADPATAKIPVALLTASQDPNLTRNAYAAGAEVTIPKAVPGHRLLHLVRTLITSRLHRQKPPAGSAA